MAYELTGTLSEIFETNEFASGFKKREFILDKTEYSGDRKFTERIKFQLTKDKCSELEQYSIGDMLKVTFNIRGSKWEKDGRPLYFVNLDVWRIEKVDNAVPEKQGVPQTQNEELPGDIEDDLPF